MRIGRLTDDVLSRMIAMFDVTFLDSTELAICRGAIRVKKVRVEDKAGVTKRDCVSER